MFNKIKNAILDFNAVDASVNTNAKAVGTATAVIVGSVASSSIVFAKDKGSGKGIQALFDSLGSILEKIYNGVNGIITGATVAVIGIGFLIRIFSKNQRSVDEATTWIKRAVLTLIAWKFLGLFMDTIDGTASDADAGYTWTKTKTTK